LAFLAFGRLSLFFFLASWLFGFLAFGFVAFGPNILDSAVVFDTV